LAGIPAHDSAISPDPEATTSPVICTAIRIPARAGPTDESGQ